MISIKGTAGFRPHLNHRPQKLLCVKVLRGILTPMQGTDQGRLNPRRYSMGIASDPLLTDVAVVPFIENIGGINEKEAKH